MSQLNQVIDALEYLKEDPMTVKRVKEKADTILLHLQDSSEINVDKALRELEEFDSADIPSYDRTLLWDIISMLESFTFLPKP